MGKKLFLFAAAAVALASCTETDLSGDTSFAKESTSDAIQFSAKAGNAGTTRAGVAGTITTASLKTGTHAASGFGVMGYQTADNLTIPLSAGQTPNFMFNQQVKWADASGVWTYSPVKYWPNGIDKANAANSPSNTAISTNTDRLSFFAYAPWVDVASSDYTETAKKTSLILGDDATGKDAFYAKDCSSTEITNGIAAFTANTVGADPQVFYYMPNADVKQAVDLLWGLRGTKQYMESDGTNNPETALENLGNSYNINLFKQTVPETVSFLFKHALSKIGGNTKSATSTTGKQKCGLKVVVDVDANGNGINGVDNQSKYLGTGSNFDNTSTLVTIKSVKVQDGASAWANRTTNKIPDAPQLYSNLKNSGWFDLAKGEWSAVTIVDNKGEKNTAADASGATYNITAERTGDYQINPDIVEPATTPAVKTSDKTKWETGDGIPNGVTTEAKNVYSDATDVPSLLMIPAATEQTLYVTVDYLVRTADPKLSNGYSQVEQIVTNKVSLAGLDVNKYYTLVMHLGLTSVKFSAIVADWAETDNATYDEDGTHDGSATSTEEIWLPSNVIAQSTETTPALGTASNVNVKANATSYTIKLKGLVEGQKIQATASAGGNIGAINIGSKDITSVQAIEASDIDAGVTTVTVTLTANDKVKAQNNLITITQKDNSDNVLTTTTVNIVQSAFDVVLAETISGSKVSTKNGDGDDIDTSGSKYAVTVVDAEGAEVGTGITKANGSITIDPAGTYTVTVKYNDQTNPVISRSIDIKKP